MEKYFRYPRIKFKKEHLGISVGLSGLKILIKYSFLYDFHKDINYFQGL